MAAEAAVPSTSTSDELSRRELDEDGFVVLRGSAFGQRFDGFARKGLPFKTADGLDFCKVNVLNDVVSKLYTLALRLLIWKVACPQGA